MEEAGRITTHDWSKYDTRTVVYKPLGLSAEELKAGYDWSYKEFYKWSNILRSCANDISPQRSFSHFLYTGGWKKLEPFWNFLIKAGLLNRTLPLLESLLEHSR